MIYVILAIGVVVVAVRIWMRRRARESGAPPPRRSLLGGLIVSAIPIASLERIGGGVGLVALREIRERVKGRVFRVGTLIILLAVAAAVIIPTLNKSHADHARVGIVGELSSSFREVVVASGHAVGAKITLVDEPSVVRADRDLRSGYLSLVVVDGRSLVVNQSLQLTDTSTIALLARTVSASMGLGKGLQEAGIPAVRAVQVANSPPLPIQSLQPAKHNSTARTTSVYGLILTYVLLTQYGTWLLMGVIEEKSSR